MRGLLPVYSCAPLRLSFGGGGTDFHAFYSRYGGLVVGSSLSGGVVVWLSDSEQLLSDVRIPVAAHRFKARDDRFATAVLDHFGVTNSLHVVSYGSVPPGTGLGSSASYLVALVAAVSVRNDLGMAPVEIAQEAYLIERDRLGRRVGLQDQYLSALGGVQRLVIGVDGAVDCQAIELAPEERVRLSGMISFLYSGRTRDGSGVLADQDDQLRGVAGRGPETARALNEILEIGRRVSQAFRVRNYVEVGHLLDEHWRAKRELSRQVSSAEIDTIYAKLSLDPRFLGGKLSGAGGGGFFVVMSTKPRWQLESEVAPYGYRAWNLRLAEWGVVAGIFDGRPLSACVEEALNVAEI